MVTVYTKEDCNPCKATKRRLTKKGISFQEVDIEVNPEALDRIKELGYMGVPVVVTRETDWNGFKPDLIDAIA